MMRKNRGFTLVEILGGLAIGALIMAGLTQMIDNSLEDTKGQQAASYQAQITEAAAKYITANYGDLAASATDTTPVVIKLDLLKTESLVPNTMQTANAYGQEPCILVLRTTVVNAKGVPVSLLNGLITTEGGLPIEDRILKMVAAESGQGGGFISAEKPAQAQGAFDSWLITATSSPSLPSFRSTSCSGTATSAGHLVSAFFYEGPGQLSTDFLYRNEVDGRPELNQMNTPIHLMTTVSDNTTDTLCASASDTGKLSRSADGKVLLCEAGVWRRQGSRFWRDPVEHPWWLPIDPTNEDGDVRMVRNLKRAFTWSASDNAWIPLAVDEHGDMKVEHKLEAENAIIKYRLEAEDAIFKRIVVLGQSCAGNPTGTVASDITGLLMSCQSGIWQYQTSLVLVSNDADCAVILPSTEFVPEAPCAKPYGGGVTWIPAVDTWMAEIRRHVTPTKAGMISANAWTQMNRGNINYPDVVGQVGVVIQICDDDTNLYIAETRAQSTKLKNDSATVNANITKVVKKNTNGYSVIITTSWSTYDGGAPPPNRSNYTNYNGDIIEQTPLSTGWNVDLLQ